MKTFGPYKVRRVLPGAGRQVSVYQAETAEGVPVLLRVMANPVDPASDEYRRFQAEFTSLQSLFHPHILPVLDVGEVEGRAYYAAPSASFHTLADHLRSGRVEFEWTDAVEIGSQLADALGHMHAARVLHRDLRLDGVVYDIDRGTAQVAEFSMVRNFRLPSLTLQGVKLGALPQVMPETTRGEPLSERSDLYQLANLIYELLAGEPGVGFDFAYRPLATRDLGVPLALDEVLAKALQEDPADRYADAAQLRAALQALLP